MSSTITNLIVDRLLSEIIEIDANKTNSSFLSGDVKLDGIKIKKTIFQKLNLPYFDLVYGYIGKINIKISLNVWSNPIKVEVSDVFLLVKQKPLDELNEQTEIDKMEQYKKSKLQSVEEIMAGVNEGVKNVPAQGGMINNIFNNLQVDIKNIVFRFEDAISYPNNPFSFGMILKKMFIKSTNKFFEDSDIFVKFSDVNYKIASIQGVNIFLDYAKSIQEIEYKNHILENERTANLDKREFLGEEYDFYCYCMSELNSFSEDEKYHYYLLFNWTTYLNSTINEAPKYNKMPRFKFEFILNNLLMNIGVKHLTIICKLLAYLSLNTLFRHGIEKKFYNKNPTLEEKKKYVQLYSNYFVEKYVRKQEANHLLENIQKFEEGLSYEQIEVLRSAASSGIESLKLGKEIEDIEMEIHNQQNQGRMGKIYSYFTSKSSIEDLNKKKELITSLKLEKQNEFEEQLKKDFAIKQEEDELSELGHNYMLYDFCIKTQYTKFTLSEDKSNNLITFYLKDFILQARLGLKWQYINIYLDDISGDQFKTKNKYFTKILESVGDDVSDEDYRKQPMTRLKNSIIEYLDNTDYERPGALNVSFEINPLLENSPYSLKISNKKRLLIYANMYAIQYTSDKIFSAIKNEFQVSEVSKMAKQEVAQLIDNGYQIANKVIQGEYQHTNIEVDIVFMGPKLILPHNIDDTSNCGCLMLNMGLIEVRSFLAPKKDKNIDYKLIKDVNLIYDIYKMNLTGFELLTVGDYYAVRNESNDKTILKMIQNVNVKIEINNSVEPKNDRFENIRIKFFIGDFKINIRDIQIEFIIYFYNHFNATNAKLAKEIEDNKKKEEISQKTDLSIFAQSSKVQEKKNFIELYKKATEIRMKDKKFAIIDFVLTKFELNFLKSISEEEISDLEKNNLFNKKYFFKEFLNFNTNYFKFSIILTDRKNLYVDANISNISLFDYDYKFKVNEFLEEDKMFCVNKEFRCIMGSINVELKPNQSRSESIYSEAHENSIDVLGSKKSFISISYVYDYQKKKQKINFNLTKFSICNNFDSLLRIAKFGKYYSDLYADITKKTNDYIRTSIRKGTSLSKDDDYNLNYMKTQYSTNAEDEKPFVQLFEKVSREENGVNKKFFSKVKDRMNKRKMACEDNENIKKIKERKETDKIEKKENDIIVLKPNVVKSQYLNKLKISFEMKEIELLFPQEPNASNTKVLKFNYNIILKMRSIQEAECLYDDDILIKMDYKKNEMNINIMIFNIDFDILNFLDNELIYNSLLTEKLICNSRISIGYNTFLILSKETSVSIANVHIEPITLVVGFRQIRVFQIFSEKGYTFWGELQKVLYTSNLQKTKTYKSKLKEKLEEMKEERVQLDLYNTNKFNSLFEVNFKMDKTQIKLIDNTSYYETPLAKFELCKISFKFLQNSDPVDTHNMGIEIVEMISGVENKNYNLNNMYYYANACFYIEVLFFNERVSDWEPIMEPWNGEINLYQVAKMTRLKVFISSDIILNMNLTHQMMVIFNNIMKKLRQTESDWVDESKNISAIQAKSIKVDNNIAIEFKNYTGMNIEFWFDSDPTNKIEIINGRTISVTRKELEFIETNIDSEIGIFTKDKFSFRIIGYNIIKNIDFSFNSMMMYPVSSENKYFEISVNIITKGNVRTVSFESNVYIYNNTHYAISLAVLNSKDLLNNVSNQEENPSINFDNAYNDVITTDEIKKVPVTWILEPHVVFAKINQVDLNFYKMLYSELGFIYRIGNELKDQGDTKNSMKSYSKFITFSKNEKTCYIGLDILVLKSTSEECKNYCYLIIINPPLIIHNYIPYPINLLKSEQDPREVIPLKNVSLYDIDIYDISNSFKFSFNYLNDVYLESEDFFPSEKLDDKEKCVKMFSKNSDSYLKHYIVSKIRFEELDYKKYFNVAFFKCEKFISKSKNLIFFVDFLVTNRFNQRVFMKVSGAKDNDPLNMLNSVIEPKQVNLFSFENSKDTKVNIRFEDTEWSRPFDVTTHGIEGVVHLNHYKEEDKIKRHETSVASVITSSSRFNHSTILILEPRFFLVNKMPFDIFFRQTSRTKPYYSNQTKIESEASMIISLKAFKSKGFKKLLQFSLFEKDEGITENIWSSDIDVDSLDDYNIKLRLPPRFDMEKYNIKEQNILVINNKHYILAKLITYTKDNGLIYLILNIPKYPQFVIRNNLSSSISVSQEGTNEEIMVSANSDSSYCWTDCIMDKKRLVVAIRDQKVKIAFEKIEKNKILRLKDEQISFSILFDNNNQTRILKIYSELKQENDEKVLKEMFGRRKIYKLTKVNINLLGFGVSIIDSTPKEMIYLSCYKIDINMITNNLNTPATVERIVNISLLLKNFQIDYCLEDSFKCIMAPRQQIKPGEQEEKAVNVTPFMQLLITFKKTENLKIESSSSKFSQIDFTMQELKAKIDQEILNNILTLVSSVVSVLDFTTYKSNNIQNSLENEKALLPWEYEEKTTPNIEKIENLEEASDEYNMIFIENLMVSSIKLNITLRINIETLQIQLIPGPLLKILSTLGNSLARITDAPMFCMEFISTNVFTDQNKLYNLLFKHYMKQGITQFYKIIGSSDLLGNPVGLLDHIGTGFIEFLNEPRKGFMQGPKKFGEGLAKGIGSLVGNVVGGGLDTVSKITGTLYSAAKNVTGDKVMLKEEEEPGNIVTGAYEGVKGCGIEVFKGVKGIFTNPYKQAKKEGVKGFFKGVGTGLLGAVISPFTAALKLGNSLIIGLRNTVTFFHKGKIITERFRHPRHINKSESLMPYDENYAEVQAMIRLLGDNSDKKIIYFYDFNYEDQMELYREMYSTIIITDHRVILCYGDKKLLLSIELNNIAQCQVHISPTEAEKYLLVFFTKKNEKKLIPTKNLPMCCQVYSIIRKIIK